MGFYFAFQNIQIQRLAMASDQLQRDEEANTASGSGRSTTLFGKLRDRIRDTARKTKELGQDDPRRVIHSFKVGLAVSLVSLFYYFDPIYDGFGSSAMWAVLTVVVVFEFSVGKFLCYVSVCVCLARDWRT